MNQFNSSYWQQGYELVMPLQVPLASGADLVCEEVARALPGRRYVCRARLDGQPVFVKLFAMTSKAMREYDREQVGLADLHAAGIAAPVMLYAETSPTLATRIVVFEAIRDPESARQRWEQGDEQQRYTLLTQLVELVARHHVSGIHHTDLHLLNFVFGSDRVLYTLDAADISKASAALQVEESTDGLADLLALLPVEYDRWLADLHDLYWRQRKGKGDVALLAQRVRDKRAYKLRKYLDKTSRSCTAFVADKRWGAFTVYDRKRESDTLKTLLADPDGSAIMQDVEMVKDGNTCTVTRLSLDGHSVISKRYNIKGLVHALSRAFRPSRAARSWRNGHLLLRVGIATPFPVAMRENRFGPLRGSAWLLVDEVPAENLYYYFHHEDEQGSDTFRAIVAAFVSLFEKLIRERISHGDMKAGNFIYHDNTLYVIDLDSMQAHANDESFASAFRQDMQRFFRNWENYPVANRLFREAFADTTVAPYLPGA